MSYVNALLPARLSAGAYILNSGIDKLRADEETRKGYHAFASGAYPFLSKADPATFGKMLAIGEVALGVALVLPVVPSRWVGLALTGFSGSLLGLYWNTPGMHKPGSPAPTQQGVPLAKDVWLAGIGLSLALARRRLHPVKAVSDAVVAVVPDRLKH